MLVAGADEVAVEAGALPKPREPNPNDPAPAQRSSSAFAPCGRKAKNPPAPAANPPAPLFCPSVLLFASLMLLPRSRPVTVGSRSGGSSTRPAGSVSTSTSSSESELLAKREVELNDFLAAEGEAVESDEEGEATPPEPKALLTAAGLGVVVEEDPKAPPPDEAKGDAPGEAKGDEPDEAKGDEPFGTLANAFPSEKAPNPPPALVEPNALPAIDPATPAAPAVVGVAVEVGEAFAAATAAAPKPANPPRFVAENPVEVAGALLVLAVAGVEKGEEEAWAAEGKED